MTDLSLKARNSVQLQADMFRLADARHSLNRRALSTLTGIPESTLKSWANGTVMPVWALGALGSAGMPDDLLSLVLAPFDHCVVGVPDGDGDMDRLGRAASKFTADLLDAKSDGRMTPSESAHLTERAREVGVCAMKVAA